MAVYSQLVPRWALQVDMHLFYDVGTSAKQLVFHFHVACANDLQQIINIEDHQTETTKEEIPVDNHWQPQYNSVNNIAGKVLTKVSKHEIPDSEKP